MTSAAAPPAPVLARMADYGIEVSSLGANAGDGGEPFHMQCVTVCILYIFSDSKANPPKKRKILKVGIYCSMFLVHALMDCSIRVNYN